MQVIMPCAGQSSRYPGTKPKYLLNMPDGRLMLEWAADNYLNKYPIRYIVSREHQEQYNSAKIIKDCFSNRQDVTVTVLDNATNGPAETVYFGSLDIDNTAIIVQDCDSLFKFDIPEHANFLCYIELADYPKLDAVASKSFMVINSPEDTVRNVVEKQVISSRVCVGSYGFESIEGFRKSFLSMHRSDREIFMSHCVKTMLNSGEVFLARHAHSYHDLGSLDSYAKFRDNYINQHVDRDSDEFWKAIK